MKFKDIVKILNKHTNYLEKNYNVGSIGIFGSTVRDQQKKNSDIDILVGFHKPTGFFKFIQLENYLSTILKKKVDLVTKRALKTVIKKEILKEVRYV